MCHFRLLFGFLILFAVAPVQAQLQVVELGTDTIYYDKNWEYISAIETEQYMESYVFYANAMEAFNTKNYFSAKASVTKAIKLNRDEIKFRMLKGWILSREQSYKKAIKLCGKILEDRDNYQEALYCKALNQYLLKDYKGSLSTYDQLISVNGMDARAYFGRAEVFSKQQRLEEAIKDYTAALLLDPALALANEGRGMAYFRLFDYPAAVKDLNQYLMAFPQSADGYYFRGLSFLRMNDYSNACKSFKASAQLNHKDANEYLKKYCEY